jgi:hypothetical protein
MAQPSSGGGGTVTDTGTPYTALPYTGPNGWYLLKFFDGSVALVFLDNKIWQWGKYGAPGGHGEFVPYYIGTTNDPNAGVGLQVGSIPHSWFQRLTAWEKEARLTPKQLAVIGNLIDGGVGQSSVISPGGKEVGGDASNKSKGITSPGIGPQNIGPTGKSPIVSAVQSAGNAISGAFGFLGFLGSLDFWKGVGLVIGGVLILYFAAKEFQKAT